MSDLRSRCKPDEETMALVRNPPPHQPRGIIGLMSAAWREDPVSTVALLVLAMVFANVSATGFAAFFIRANSL